MNIYHTIILALIQGLTEFIPVSSSGHLIVVHEFIGESAGESHWGEDLTMDVAVHVGTLFSVLLYFHKDIWSIVKGMLGIFRGKTDSEGFSLGMNVLVASIPVILIGLVLERLEPEILRSPAVIAWSTLIFGIVLWAADKYFPSEKTLEKINFKNSFIIGLAQALALVPGVSRSGITMTAGRALGFSRTESARFSLLLAIVAISGAGALQGWSLIESHNVELGMNAAIAVFLSFISGLGAISLMMKWLSKATFTPFAIYRVAMGIVLILMPVLLAS